MIRILIGLNILVFAAWSLLPFDFMFQHFLVSYTAVLDGRIHTLLTSVFSHEALFHLLLNMFVLNSFGPVMMEVLGAKRFLRFYLAAGVIASVGHCLVSAFILSQPDLPALGASGALSGIVMLFSLLFPNEKLLFMGIVPVRAIWGALAFIAVDVWGVVAQTHGGGFQIGHGAHLGGAIAGAVYYLFLRTRKL